MNMILLTLFSVACIQTQKGEGNQALNQACTNLCEQQRSGEGCDGITSGSDCEQSCSGIVAAVSSDCEAEAQAAWACLANASWVCVDGASPELEVEICEDEQVAYLNCIEGNDTAG